MSAINWRVRHVNFQYLAGAALTTCCLTLACAFASEEFTEHESCLHGKLELAEAQALTAAAAWDEATGADKRNFPRDRFVDYGHMTLEVRFDDLNDMRFTATETLSFIPIGRPTDSLELDAIGLQIDSVTLNGKPVTHFRDDETISLSFDPLLPVGKEHTLVFEYVCDHPYDGMFFTPYSPDAPHYSAEVHTQGQAETNRHWFIAHDFPNERMTTELIVDVPAGFQASGNGRLLSHDTKGDREIWRWLQDKPHVSYLVSLVIGKFDVVELEHHRVPMKVWVPVGQGVNVERTYGNTGAMIDLFEARTGVQYPWDRYDQLTVKNFGAGGMENTSATSMYPTAILDETARLDGDLDSLIAHELGHQWTGDMITCKSWEHIWLNEGWATYFSALWFEQRDGEDGYYDSMRRQAWVARRDKTADPVPMVSPIYEGPWETFRRRANPYPKGASILHMLRTMLGEEVFWAGVQKYMNEHKFGVVETNDFRYALEEVSGLGLEWFFEQWCYRPGTPELDVTVDYDARNSELLVDVRQTQQIDERTPAFRFDLPVSVRTSSGDATHMIGVTEKQTNWRVKLDDPPSMVAIDPKLCVLKTITEHKPIELWYVQATDGPTISAKHDAIAALGETETPRARELLVSFIEDDQLRYTLRNSAIRALRGFGSDVAKAEILRMVRDGVDDARVRVDLIEALQDQKKDDVVELLADLAENDPSYGCRVAAISAMSHHEAKDRADLIVTLVDVESQHDQIRSAALSALADFDDERGLGLAMKYAGYGYVDRSRPRAIDAVGKLAKHDTDSAVEFLIGLLDDPEPRPRTAAMSALAEIGDERGLEPLDTIAEKDRDPEVRERAKGAVDRLREKLKENENGEEGAGGEGQGGGRGGVRGERPARDE